MDIYLLDDNFSTIYTLDVFESFIWTERFNGAGDFEFYMPVSDRLIEIVSYLQSKMIKNLDCYAYNTNTKTIMIVEAIEITTSLENGKKIAITGRGLESILERRIIWLITRLTGNFQNAIKKLLTDAIISPTNTKRKILNFVFKASTDSSITKLTIDAQFEGDNLYETIHKLCEIHDIGFDVTYDLKTLKFTFELKAGTNRTYDGSVPWVVFSPEYDNLIASDYIESPKTYKNVTLVDGEQVEATMRQELQDVTKKGYYQYMDMTKWTESHSGTYYFNLVDGYYYSNNTGKSSTSASSTFTCPTNVGNDRAKVRISYGVSSEPSYDKFTITINGTTLVDAISGDRPTTTLTYVLNKNTTNTIVATYTKDGSVDKGTDQAWFRFDTEYPDEEFVYVVQEYVTVGEPAHRKNVTVIDGTVEKSGLERRELYTDGTDVQSKDENGNAISDTTYYNMLRQKGKESLAENKYTKAFTGEVEAVRTFVYGVDFFIGDQVQIVNEYKMQTKARIIEFIISQDENGYKTYPTFRNID